MPSKLTSDQYSQAASDIRGRYKSFGLHLDPGSGLGQIILAAEGVKGRAPDAQITTRQIFDAMAAIDIRDSLTALDDHPAPEEFMRRLVRGSLSSYDLGPSTAKDTLWELDVCSKMRRAGFAAELDEPDVIWRDNGPTGISCKRIYSENRVQSALSKAVTQLSASSGYGFVAMNIDELMPPKSILEIEEWAHADSKPQRINASFLSRHERHFQKYFSRASVSAVVVACACRAVLRQPSGRPAFFFNVQWQAWSRPDLPREHHERAINLTLALNRLTRASN